MKDPYFDIPAISNSALKWFKKSPMHYQWYINNPQPTTEAMNLGTAAHLMILEPERFKSQYAVLDLSKRPESDKTMGSNKNKEWLKEFNLDAEKSDKSVITQDQFDCIESMRDAVMSNSFARELILDGGNIFEHVVEWEENSVHCKAKLDIANHNFVADLKTCQDAGKAFNKVVWNMEYYRQAGMYLDGFFTELLFKDIPFYFIAVEKTAPFGVAVYKCSQDLIDYGTQEYKDLVAQYKACSKANKWPSYEKDAVMDYFELDLPGWVNHNYQLS